jgi:hypothetical protein
VVQSAGHSSRHRWFTTRLTPEQPCSALYTATRLHCLANGASGRRVSVRQTVPPVVERCFETVCGSKPTRTTRLVLLSARRSSTSSRWRGAKLAGWIGRRGTTEWPPRLPDLVPKDVFSSSVIWSHWRPLPTHIQSTTLKKLSSLLRQDITFQISECMYVMLCETSYQRVRAKWGTSV